MDLDHLKSKVTSSVAHMKSVGVTKIALIGFCWGGVPVVHCLSELASEFVCGVIPHPSLRLLEMVYGIDPLPVLTAVTKPVLLMPAGNDPDNLKTGGEFIKALQVNSPESDTIVEFEDQKHGWVVRGDIADAAVKEKVELALNKAYAFIGKYM